MNLSECSNSIETYDTVAELVFSKPLEQVKEILGKQFFKAEDTIEFLYLVLTSKSNGILHGPGGFGKSQVTKAFLELYGIPSIVKVGHSSMDVEALLGIPNIEKLTKESTYEIAFEKSVFSFPGVLILEEFLDVKPMVAASLKDILSEGGYREGNAFTPSKVGPVIICSNKSPDEVSVDFSTAAFYKERFPFSTYVCWDSFSMSDYLSFFRILYKEEVDTKLDQYELLAELCAHSYTSDTIISPRLAIKARDAFLSSNKIEHLQYINSLDYSKIDLIKLKLQEKKQLEQFNTILKELHQKMIKFELKDSKEYTAFLYLKQSITKQLQHFTFIGDEVLATSAALLKLFDQKLDEFEPKLKELGKLNMTVISSINSEYEKITKYINS